MKHPELERWAEGWERAGKALEALRQRELQAMTDDDVRQAVTELLTIPLAPDMPPRADSGLVEQQRLFAKFRVPA